jgi:hypothetical protein
VIGWYSRASTDSGFPNVAATSSTCQYMTARPGPGRRAGKRPPAVGEPQFVRVAADAELGVGGPSAGSWPREVRLDAEQLGVPPLRRIEVIGRVVDRGESRQHRVLLHHFCSPAAAADLFALAKLL